MRMTIDELEELLRKEGVENGTKMFEAYQLKNMKVLNYLIICYFTTIFEANNRLITIFHHYLYICQQINTYSEFFSIFL